MFAPYAPFASRFFSATTCAAFFRNISGSSKSHIRSPRRAILSLYAGPLPHEVVPILSAPRTQKRHNFTRDWAGVRRQDGAAWAADVRFAGAGDVSKESRARSGGEKPAGERRVRGEY